MARYVAPDRGVRETVIGNSTYLPDKGGIYNVESAAHGRAMKAEGFFEAALNPYDSKDGERGYTCVECGFGSWFLKCSRCGHENTKENKKDGD
jgi:DNA-directed RNA polymerase subunit RPC12/RpoP